MTFRLLAAVCLILPATGCAPSPARPTAPVAPPLDLAEWQYPGALESATIQGAEVSVNDEPNQPPRIVDVTPTFQLTTVSDPFEAVFEFYAKKLGVAPEYVPGKTAAASTPPPSITDTRAGVPPLLTGSIAHAGRPGRVRVKTATLVKHDGSGDVVVIISRGEGEDVTNIEVLLIRRPTR